MVGIYNASISGRMATADTEPVSPDSRRGWLRDRDSGHHPLWVLERDGHVVGWLSFGKFYGRPAYAATAEVSVYVDPVARREGHATHLMKEAVLQAPRLCLTTLLAFVFSHNEPSLAFCRKFCFQPWGQLPRVARLDGIERDLVILGRRIE